MQSFIRVSVFLMLMFAFSYADVINVPADQSTIQAGIDAAANGDTVLVAVGTYTENINYLGKAITVASHYIVNGDTNHIANTIIDGSQPSNPDSGSVVTFNSGEDTTSVLSGFTISGGSGTISQYTWQGQTSPYRTGGGIFCYESGARITANIISGNSVPFFVESSGGGICAYGVTSGAFVRIDSNKIVSNVVNSERSWASAICFASNGIISNNEISFNTSNASVNAWGAVGCWSETPRSVLIKDNHISHNTLNGANTYGGGIEIDVAMSATIVGNTITGHQASSVGGGIWLWGKIVPDIIDANFISGNAVTGGGGGIMLEGNADTVNTLITNNIISGNAAAFGGGIRCLNSKAQIINNTIVDNTVSVSGGGIRVEGASSETTIMNTILWGNSAPVDPQIAVGGGGVANVVYSDVQGGWTGEGNIDADPFFADTLFRLSNNSPCNGAGIDSIQINTVWYHAPDHDFSGNPRPMPDGTMPDMGAWEMDYSVSIGSGPLVSVPESYELKQNYPNPFNPGTTIEFALAKPGWVTLKIYNILGQEVAELVSEDLNAGSYKYNWDSRSAGLASGVYYYKLEAEGFVQTKKMLLIR